MAGYPSVADLKDFARSEIPTADDSLYATALSAAITEIRRSTMRELTVAPAIATTRVFTPASETSVVVDDCVQITSIVCATTTITAYQTTPLNGIVAGEARPIERIDLVTGQYFTYGTYSDREATISVTARWGWLDIPEPIRFATLILAKDILSNRDVRFGLVAVTEAAGIGARTNSTVRSAIDAHRRVESWGIA
jgi:hypothetical protein